MRKIVIFSICLLSTFLLKAQDSYQKGWEALDNANIEEAIKHFESALKKPALKNRSLLVLTMLNSRFKKNEKASKYFKEFFDNTENPYPELYALWFSNGVIGQGGKKKDYQLDLLKKIEKDKNNIGKLDGGTQYRLITHYLYAADKKNSLKHLKKVSAYKNWLMLGPFDNVMNSGYDKDFGVLAKPELDAKFTSKYGADISWFESPIETDDCYMFKYKSIYASNSILYAQSFIEADEEQEVILKLGYSGSLKVWINDTEIYREPERRNTEMDYFQFKCTLNKGFNRVLIQLGDYEKDHANFVMRISDTSHNLLELPQSTKPQPYTKELKKVEQLPNFAIESLTQKAENDILYQFLLANAYLRSGELNNAEDILLSVQKERPKNYFFLRNLILLYKESGQTTNQNKYYDLFQENYPEDIDILENKIDEFAKESDKVKLKEYVKNYLSKYPNYYNELSYRIAIGNLDQDNELVLRLIDSLYHSFPDDYQALSAKYNIEKNYYSKPKEANRILEKYLEKNYSASITSELASNYLEEGMIDKAISQLRKKIELIPTDYESYKNIINILTRQSKYDKAIDLCNVIIENRPSDYATLKDLAVLYKFKNDDKSALKYYEQALQYYPFSFDTNEKIRELKGQTIAVDLIPELEPAEIIKEFEANFTPTVKKSYEIVIENKSVIVFKSKSRGERHSYILKLNDDSALEYWQKINYSAGSNMEVSIDEAKTIKKSGETIDAERNNGELVFTNLEIGDYIYVSSTEKQYSGGKSTLFISDRFTLNSSYPYYKVDYNLFLEDGLSIQKKIINDEMKPEITTVEGFKKYNWSKTNPMIVKEESNQIPFNDISQRIHISLDQTWSDIVQWYSDLTTHQAAPDYTIKKITEDLFEGKNLTDGDKARTIYDFVCKNIQYSSIDFRQSGFIPQKASKIYNSKLGDCKDVSTLYVSLARSVGLESNLVLINTSDNGTRDVILPSLNFNHCIVKVYLDEGDTYLELTDPNLPFGHLYPYHIGATILEIPPHNVSDDAKLEALQSNQKYKNGIERNSVVNIQKDFKMNVAMNTEKIGTLASGTCNAYYDLDDKERKDKLKKLLSNRFKSTMAIKNLDFQSLEPRNDLAKYSYDVTVDNDVLKLGSFGAVKVPFSDLLIEMKIFEEEEREYDFNFIYYETADYYNETIEINLDPSFTLMEVPKDIHLSYNDFTYDLTFKQLGEQKLIVERKYKVNRENIKAKDFLAFRAFMEQVHEAENAHLLFQR